jgi:DNA-directed RNA polymerase specialized sigma54-like protein
MLQNYSKKRALPKKEFDKDYFTKIHKENKRHAKTYKKACIKRKHRFASPIRYRSGHRFTQINLWKSVFKLPLQIF